VPSDIASLLRQVKEELDEEKHDTQVTFSGDPIVAVRPDAFKRCISNLVANAQRHAGRVVVEGSNDQRFLTINVDDDGPGIAPEQREDVFKPFFRLDEARNQDEAGTGLGLAIARDIARSHGGDIQLSTSPLGGLRATLRIPV
jgi:two-component system osmolarity sensor histidine kinase EnvZ